jgi:hypothetical protein
MIGVLRRLKDLRSLVEEPSEAVGLEALELRWQMALREEVPLVVEETIPPQLTRVLVDHRSWVDSSQAECPN